MCADVFFLIFVLCVCCVCVCVFVCLCVYVASVARLVRELHLENGNIQDVEVVGLRTST